MNAKTVYVLGSGFSKCANLPVTNELFQELMGFQERSGENDKDELLNAISFLYPNFDKSNKFPDSFEEYFSLLDCATGLKNIFPHDYWDKKRKSTLRLLTDYFAKQCEDAKNNQYISAFVKNLELGDVIITFNWDILLENELIKQNRPFDYFNHNQGQITVLKLHGSINWYQLLDEEIHESPNTVKWLEQPKLFCKKDFQYAPEFWDLSNREPLILAPTFNKSIRENKFLLEIWHQAFEWLIQSEKCIIIGYSMPKEDLLARTLLVSSLGHALKIKKHYYVINPDKKLESHFKEYVNENCKFIDEAFSLDALAKTL